MAIQKTFSIYDSAAKSFLAPFFCGQAGEALRNFKTAANDPQHMFHKHPTDYTLFEIGYFDDEIGRGEYLDAPHSLGMASQFIEDTSPMPSNFTDLAPLGS